MWSPERVAVSALKQAVILSASEARGAGRAGGREADLCEAPEDSGIW